MTDKIFPTDFSTITPTLLFGDSGTANGNVVVATDLVANSDANIPTQKAVKTAIAAAIVGGINFKGSTDCSTNPNYPAAVKGDLYMVSVAGKIGGASGADVAVGDSYFAIADNAGGTQAAVGSSWDILEHNIPDLATIATTGSASDLVAGTVPDARFPATLPAVSGVNLTNLNASNLASGTVPDARFPATLPAISGANLTNLNATNLASGTVPDARFPATLPAVSGVNLTNLNASNLASGTVPDARFPATLPAVSGVNLTNLNASNLASGTVPDARFPATLPAVSGVNLTALNATQLTSGTVPDARFPATLPAVSGVNLTALNATQLTSGTVPVARFPTNELICALQFMIDGFGSVIPTGGLPFREVNFAYTITTWTVIADVSGSVVFDILRSTSVTSPSGTSIVGGGNGPTLTSAQGATAAVSGWTSTAIAAGDVLQPSVTSATTVTKVTCNVYGTRT